jgi:hypothetical protein
MRSDRNRSIISSAGSNFNGKGKKNLTGINRTSKSDADESREGGLEEQ